MDYPVEVAGTEIIVRCIFHPRHVSSDGSLKKDAFEPDYKRPGGISVIRHDFVGTTYCKNRGKEIEARAASSQRVYKGLAVLVASEITSLDGATIVDSRNQYEGHADIFYRGVLWSHEQEAAPAEIKEKARAYAKLLFSLARYYPDPDPGAGTWSGNDLA